MPSASRTGDKIAELEMHLMVGKRSANFFVARVPLPVEILPIDRIGQGKRE